MMVQDSLNIGDRLIVALGKMEIATDIKAHLSGRLIQGRCMSQHLLLAVESFGWGRQALSVC